MDTAASESPEATPTFGELLRRYRLAASISQERLAERAGVSSRSIQAIERGENRPQQETARRLAEALALDEQDRARLLQGVTPVPRRRAVAGATPAAAEPALAPVPASPEAALSDGMLTVLVADVRGYTAFTHLHGDAAGAALATRFAALAGEVVAAQAGRVVEVRGDEVLAVFTSARAALRAAASLQARCAQQASVALPLQAGVGLDVGEPVAVDGGYRGESINVAARLCAQAGPGEVLASEAVIHLARRVEGLAYQERGELVLKGLPRPVRTWGVRAASNEQESIEAPTSGTTQVVMAGPGVPQATPIFGELLRHYRLAAGISQERLAERAGLSVQALSALENGRRQVPYRHTVALLVQALGLAADETALLQAAVVRGRTPAALAPAAGRQDWETAPEPQMGADTTSGARAAQPARTNLPLALTSFIGRAHEQAEVRGLLGAARLVTLTGAGGAGKTRLALAVAGELVREYVDGVWLVDLAALADPPLVASAVAAVLGLREEPRRAHLDTLIDHLKARDLLLVLDNCEHLVAACAALAEALLRACLGLHILATSREGLEVAGEHLYRVPSLPVPKLDQLPALEDLSAYAAVALFLARAQERWLDFKLAAQNARAVAQICARLDGMPLAIELAAARVGSLPVEAIATRLDDRFRLLTGGPRTAVPRQQTLRATLDWSYDLLGEGEQRLLHRLSVFAGSWTLAAAEVVCGGAGIEEWEVADLLASLVNKSLVLLEDAGANGEQGRYRLLETIREYALERLAHSGEHVECQRRHAGYFLRLAEEAEPAAHGPQQRPWLNRLEIEHDNLRAALGWVLERGEDELAVRLCGALWRFWWIRGYLTEGRAWLAKTLAQASGTGVAVQAAVQGAGALAFYQGDYAAAQALHERSLALCRAAGNRRGGAWSLVHLGWMAVNRGDLQVARALCEESLAIFQELGDGQGVARSLCLLGVGATFQGDTVRARPLLEDSLAVARELDDEWNVAWALVQLGCVDFVEGNAAAAQAYCDASLRRWRALGDQRLTGITLALLGMIAFEEGDVGTTRAHVAAALAMLTQLGERWGLTLLFSTCAGLAANQGQPERALRLEGYAAQIMEELGMVPLPFFQAIMERWLARVQLPPSEAAAARGQGQAMTLEQAMAEAHLVLG
jgi:non-specific serine/threonine protein kinase